MNNMGYVHYCPKGLVVDEDNSGDTDRLILINLCLFVVVVGLCSQLHLPFAYTLKSGV